VPKEDTDKYGIVNTKVGKDVDLQVHSIVEKPKPEQASSNLAVVGRYILTPRTFELLEETKRGAGGEIQLTDAISALLEHETVFAHRFKGKRYDCGSKLGYLKATVDFGLKHHELGNDFRNYLSTVVK
jgi:UTP--glucose-1-phosphate uridylyltransferase